jgi:hypothetical protein
MNWQHKFAETEILETEKIDSSPKSMNMTWLYKKRFNNDYTVMHEMFQSVDINTVWPEMKCLSLY